MPNTGRNQRRPGRGQAQTHLARAFSAGRSRTVPVLLSVLAALTAVGCGEGEFVVSNESYEPRIVIEGFLQPGPGVDRIHIWRNFPLTRICGR